MIRQQIVSSTGVDRQNQEISVDELMAMASAIIHDPMVARMSVEHDPTIIPLGKVYGAEVIELQNGSYALQALIDDFSENFKQLSGPNGEVLYMAESQIDSRPFRDHSRDEQELPCISLNPICFSNDECRSIDQMLSQQPELQFQAFSQKTAIPEIQVIVQLVTGTMVLLTLRKSLQKSSDKLAEEFSEDVVRLYKQVKQFLSSFARSIACGREKTYIISEPNQPIELVVVTKDASVLMEAFDSLSDGHISDQVQKYLDYFDGEIDKIQFSYSGSDNRWKLEFLTTKSGVVIGTEKCYKRSIALYQKVLKTPGAGFSINSPVTIQEERDNEKIVVN